MSALALPPRPPPRPPLARQLAWAQGQAAQRRRILSRLEGGSTNLAAVARARHDLGLAEAIVASLQALVPAGTRAA